MVSCVQVYEHTREAADWAELLQPGQSMGVQARVWSNESGLTNSQLVQRRVGMRCVTLFATPGRLLFHVQGFAKLGGDARGYG